MQIIHKIDDFLFTIFPELRVYYVSWVLAMPDKVDQLGLPYQQEYELAKQMQQQNSANK